MKRQAWPSSEALAREPGAIGYRAACGGRKSVTMTASVRCIVHASFSSNGATIMSKAQDSKKAVKKEPAKSPKEKKEAKKLKKEASKRQ